MKKTVRTKKVAHTKKAVSTKKAVHMKIVGKYVEEFKDEETGETIKKIIKLVEPEPEYKESIPITVFIPKDKRKRFYTITDIIEIAGKIFDFSITPKDFVSKSVTDTNSIPKYYSIKKYVIRMVNSKL